MREAPGFGESGQPRASPNLVRRPVEPAEPAGGCGKISGRPAAICRRGGPTGEGTHPMTYPPPRYLGDNGEVNATFRPVGTGPELSYPSGGTAHYLATGATTNGQFGLYRWEMPAEPSGPEPHFHRSISESFYLLTGSVRIFNGTRWIDTAPGDFVHVPEGGVHGFRNESGEPASMLLHFSPGAPREAYFEGLLELAGKSEEEKAEFFLRHDTFWV